MLLLTAMLLAVSPALARQGYDQAMEMYRGEGAGPFDAGHGKELWYQVNHGDDGKERTCHTCHGKDLNRSGKHARTGKVIDPMAPSVNPERFTELKKIEKWFKRNCKWTFGRECTSQEKGDILSYLIEQ